MTVLGYQLLVFPRVAAGARFPALEGALWGALVYGIRDMSEQGASPVEGCRPPSAAAFFQQPPPL